MMFPNYQNMMPFSNDMTWANASWFIPLVSVLMLWDLVWKGVALWGGWKEQPVRMVHSIVSSKQRRHLAHNIHPVFSEEKGRNSSHSKS